MRKDEGWLDASADEGVVCIEQDWGLDPEVGGGGGN